MQPALLGVMTAFVAFIALVVVGGVIFGSVKFYQQLAALNDNMKGVPMLLEGIQSICKDLAVSTVQMGDSVNKFGKTVLSTDEPTSGSRRDGFRPYDVQESARAWQEQQRLEAEATGDVFQIFEDS